MEFEIEERPQAGEVIWHSYSDRFTNPRQPMAVPHARPELLDRAIRIPDQEAGS